MRAPASIGSELTPDDRRSLQGIRELPKDEREALDQVRVQVMMQREAVQVPGSRS
jgi:hypothetical protein